MLQKNLDISIAVIVIKNNEKMTVISD